MGLSRHEDRVLSSPLSNIKPCWSQCWEMSVRGDEEREQGRDWKGKSRRPAVQSWFHPRLVV